MMVGADFHSTDLILAYQAGALTGFEANAATAARSAWMSMEVLTSTDFPAMMLRCERLLLLLAYFGIRRLRMVTKGEALSVNPRKLRRDPNDLPRSYAVFATSAFANDGFEVLVSRDEYGEARRLGPDEQRAVLQPSPRLLLNRSNNVSNEVLGELSRQLLIEENEHARSPLHQQPPERPPPVPAIPWEMNRETRRGYGFVRGSQ